LDIQIISKNKSDGCCEANRRCGVGDIDYLEVDIGVEDARLGTNRTDGRVMRPQPIGLGIRDCVILCKKRLNLNHPRLTTTLSEQEPTGFKVIRIVFVLVGPFSLGCRDEFLGSVRSQFSTHKTNSPLGRIAQGQYARHAENILPYILLYCQLLKNGLIK
jgi:hypothetical protein